MSSRACLFGTYNRQHSANRLLRATLESAGYAVAECHVPLWERTRDKSPAFFGAASLVGKAAEYARAVPSLVKKWKAIRDSTDLLVVGFNGQLDLLLARRLVRGRVPILFAPLVTVSETLVDDRAIYTPGSPAARLARWLDGATLREASLVLSDTDAHGAYISEEFGVPRAKVRTLYLGAEPLFFRAPAATDAVARSVLFYGQYVGLHGVKTIVEAARIVDGRLAITLAGSGPDRHAAEALANGIPNLRFVDWIPYEELPRWIGEADVCLGIFGKSRKAAMVVPNKVYQAAAGGRAIVTADTPAVREVFTDDENVCLVPPGNAPLLADALIELATDGPRCGRLGANAHRLMCDRFGLEGQGRRLRRLIAETIG